MVKSFLNRQIKRPDLWALHLKCVACDWHTQPTGPYRLRDVFWWIESCPECKQPTVMVVPDCPYCSGKQVSPKANASPLDMIVGVTRLFRIPRSLQQALWGHFTCRDCGKVYDKWGRKIDNA